MLKYNEKYFVLKQKLPNGKPSPNKDDNYIQCKKNGDNYIQIYRYNESTLAVLFWTTEIANSRTKQLKENGVNIKPFVIGKSESVYLFPEKDLKKVAKVVGARKRIKRELTDEEKQIVAERLRKARKSNVSR